ncbi:hypothetical protein DJ568_10250 [Mucilaginibacter hurinus]|uniref:Uncharacterized protein n=1 Tax=Mucilaginibacter hurinus TaxID=2201324 RepID=A0A367GMY2_9SPHI|nr:hypothetical protein [Mucilaginibacter hurinus]RCH54852.1 hypothetical protein DJ568_10250 [Mucilaginibacter hurinus]
MKIVRPILIFFAFTLVLAALPAYFWYQRSNIILPEFWILFSFISGLTFIVVLSILISQQINPDMYAQTFIAGTVFKILAILAFTVIFLLKTHVDKSVFVLNFIYIYFLNTAFEVYILLRNLRNQNLK